jgi:hypothetical protein
MRSVRFALPFLGLGIAMCSFAAAADKETRLFEMRVYYAAPGKLDDLNKRFRDHTARLFAKHGITNIGYFVPAENPDNKLVYFLAYKDMDSCKASWAAFGADPEWKTASKASEANGKLVSKIESYFLTPTDYSPVVTPKVSDKERAFELRVYTTNAGKLDALNGRFRDHTTKLFEKHGMTNVGYWTLTGNQKGDYPKAPALKSLGVVDEGGQKAQDVTLVYLLAHPSKEAHDKAFDAFRVDPEWKAALAASEEKAGGSLTVKDGVKSFMLKPTDYSPAK